MPEIQLLAIPGLLWIVIAALWSSEPTAVVHNAGQTQERLITISLLQLLISEQVFAISNSSVERGWEVNSGDISGKMVNKRTFEGRSFDFNHDYSV